MLFRSVLQPIDEVPESLKLTQPQFDAYALGWDVSDYRGTRIVSHAGAVFGFQTMIVLIPDKEVGFSIEINCEDSEILFGLMDELLDHYLGFPRTDWLARWQAEKQHNIGKVLEALKAPAAQPAAVGPSLPLDRYAGIYSDPWYGNIEVSQDAATLKIDFKSTPRMSGTLEHWQYDTFVTHFSDKSLEPAYVTFGLGAQGQIERVTMKAVSPAADFSYDYHDLLFVPMPKAPAK